jgi:hypothetical protein
VNLVPTQHSESPPQRHPRNTWFRRYRRARIALTMLILIGITTPHATSAPAGEAQIDVMASIASVPSLDSPPVIMLIGAAMLVLAGALRRTGDPKIRN